MEEPARWQLYSLLYPGSAGSLFYGVAIQSWMPEIAWDLFEDSSGVSSHFLLMSVALLLAQPHCPLFPTP